MTNRFMDYSTYRAPQTNADRIRNMTDEELADAIEGLHMICEICINLNDNCLDGAGDCRKGILGWLKSEAKE